MRRFTFGLLTFIAFSLQIRPAFADRYFYYPVAIRCETEVTRQTLGTTEQSVGRIQRRAGYKFIQIQSASSSATYLTSYCDGVTCRLLPFLERTAIPDPEATLNIPIAAPAASHSHILTATHPTGRSVAMTQLTVSPLPGESASFQFAGPLTLQGAQEIMESMRIPNVPDFSVDSPALLELSNVPGTKDLTSSWPGQPAFREYQIHYPLWRLNGLSFHIRFTCTNSRDIQ